MALMKKVEQVFFAFEVVVDPCLGESALFGDERHRRCVETMLEKQLQSDIGDLGLLFSGYWAAWSGAGRMCHGVPANSVRPSTLNKQKKTLVRKAIAPSMLTNITPHPRVQLPTAR